MKTDTYSATARAFHWAIAGLVMLATGLALFRETFGPWDVWMISVHKVVGLAILLVAVTRLAWRLRHQQPLKHPELGRREAKLASGVHWLMYFLAVIVPAAGWIFVSLAPEERPLDYRGLHSIPELPLAANDSASFAWHEIHEILGFMFVGLFLLHFAGLLRHHMLGHRGVAERMLPQSRSARLLIAAVVVLWILGLSLDSFGVQLL
jgi:cytochrome b561